MVTRHFSAAPNGSFPPLGEGWDGGFSQRSQSITLTLLTRPAMNPAAFAAHPPPAPIPAFPQRGKEQSGSGYRGDLERKCP